MVAVCANAQTLKVAANVPFDFAIDKASLPAGSYNIDAIDNSKALIVRGAEGGKMVLSDAAGTLNPSPDTRLVFHRYGDRYFLSQIWVAGETEGRQLHMSRREAEVAKNTQASENVIVLASLR
jgi:hypothetical protein